MKRRELEKRLRALGWKFRRHGRKHDVWTDAEEMCEDYIPRHTEINEELAKAILRTARRHHAT